MSDVHSCSVYCDLPRCVKSQRDEMRDRVLHGYSAIGPKRTPVAKEIKPYSPARPSLERKDVVDHRPVDLLTELRIEAAIVPRRRGQLYTLAADEIERLYQFNIDAAFMLLGDLS